MKKLNSNTLFDIFSIGDEEVYAEHGITDLLDNPVIQFGMIVRGVENYYIIDKLYERKFGEEYSISRNSIKVKYFIGLLKYLERIKDIQADTLSIIEDEFGIESINYALEEMLEVFVSVEYYEQCAILKKYLDLFSLKKLV